MLAGTLAKIESFGAVGAEDDEFLLNYFLSTPAVNLIQGGSKMLVLGRKGSGKTTIVRYFENKSGQTDVHIALKLGQYPWGAHAQRKNSGAAEMDLYSSSWRYLIAVKVLSSLMTTASELPSSQEVKLAKEFLKENFEGSDVKPKDILTSPKIRMGKSSLGLDIKIIKGEVT